MFTNRITNFLDRDLGFDAVAVPRAAFVLFPLAIAPAPWAQQIYEDAYARARAAAEPRRQPLPNLACWN